MLYHGSSHDISVLEPRPSIILENEKAIFATDSFTLAAAFIPKWTDCDFIFGYHEDRMYIIEVWPGAFINIFSGVSGWIYGVNDEGFVSDKRLGMQQHEFINKKNVKVQEKHKIDDVMKYLEKSKDIDVIKYEDMITTLYDANIIKNNKTK